MLTKVAWWLKCIAGEELVDLIFSVFFLDVE